MVMEETPDTLEAPDLAEAPKPKRRNRFIQPQWAELLEDESFKRYFFMRLASNAATNALTYTLLVFTARHSASAIATGLLLLSIIIPSAMLGAVAGVAVDRLPRGLILCVSNGFRAALVFALISAKDDLVLIFFACHGAPDPYRPDVLYLLTYDTDYDDIATTALPMDEIDRTLRSYIRAKHVVVIADTCHSAAIGSVPGGRDGLNSAEITNRYLEEMSKTKPGVALLTSARRNELAFEGEQWGGGHGVFTHFLLQGMRGHAEGYKRAKDGIVRIDELFDFVRDHVSAATNTNQNPHFALGSDNRLPMAITGGLDAQEHYQLGCQLYELGWLIDDAGRFQSAARQFEEAIRLAKAAGPEFPQAELELGKSLVASKQYGRQFVSWMR